MTTRSIHDREVSRRLVAEAKAQRSRELRAAADQALQAFRWKEFALVGVVCLTVAGVAACSG